MARKPSVVDVVERKVIKGIQSLRDAADKRFNKFMRLAEKTTNEEARRRYFNTALRTAQRTEALVEQLEDKMAAIKNPWSAPKKKARKKKK